MKTFAFKKETQSFKTEEAYKTLRTNLLFCGGDIQTIVVTSCAPNDGKSTVARNIAANMSETGRRVLLIDADMRKSVFLGQTVVDGEVKGLSNLLSDMVELNDIVYQNENHHNMYMIFSGSFPPNPPELLGSKRFKMLIKKMRENFDYIVIDAPPIGSVIDSAIIATVCDGIVLVVRSGDTSYKFAKSVKEQLEKTNTHILGVVLNGVNEKEGSGYYYGSYKSYKDYYTSDDKKGKKK